MRTEAAAGRGQVAAMRTEAAAGRGQVAAMRAERPVLRAHVSQRRPATTEPSRSVVAGMPPTA
jgi:hypothetical protein